MAVSIGPVSKVGTKAVSAGAGDFKAASVASTPIKKISVGAQVVWSSGIDVADDFEGRSAMGPDFTAFVGHDLAKGLPEIRGGVAQPPRGSGGAGLYGAVHVKQFEGDSQEVLMTVAKGTDEFYPDIGMGAMLRCSADHRAFAWFMVANNGGALLDAAGKNLGDGTTFQNYSVSNGTVFVCRAVGNRYTMTGIDGTGNQTVLIDWTDATGKLPLGAANRRWGFITNKQTYGWMGYRFAWCVDAIRGRDI